MQNKKKFDKKISFLALSLFAILLLNLGLVSSAWTSELNEGLINYITFNQTNVTEGASVSTSVGANCIIDNGDFTSITGIINQAFNSSEPTPSDLDCGTTFDISATDYTINLWLLIPNNDDYDPIIVTRDDGGSNQFMLVRNNAVTNTLEVSYAGNILFTPDESAIEDGNWHMITITHEDIGGGNYNVSMYYDGVLNTSVETIYTFANEKLRLGRQGASGNFFSGGFDEYGMWNRTLSQSSIQQLYNNGYGITYDESPQQSWFDTSFGKRKAISIQENTGNNWVDYSVYLNVTKTADMNADFSDLRFVDGSDTTLLPYYIETYNSNSAQVWVKTDLVGNSNNTIYMYYKKPSATTQSNKTSAFVWYDDATFNRTSEYSILGSAELYWNNTNNLYWINGLGGDYIIYPTSILNQSNVSVDARLMDIETGYSTGTMARYSNYNTGYHNQKVNADGRLTRNDAGSVTGLLTISASLTNGVFHNSTFRIFGDNLTGYVDGVYGSVLDSTYGNKGYSGIYGYDTDNLFSYLRIRPYGNPEPNSYFGIEEIQANATTDESISMAFVSPTSNGTLAGEIQINANVSVTTNNLTAINVYLTNSSNYVWNASSTTSPYYVSFIDLPLGVYYLNATASNDFGNSTSTETRTITINSALLMRLVPPTSNGTVTLTNSITANVSITSLNLTRATVWLYNDTGYVSSYNSTDLQFLVTFSSLENATYYLNATGINGFGTENYTDTRTILLAYSPVTPPTPTPVTSYALYDVLATSGAGLAVLVTYIARSLPYLLLGLAVVIVFIAVAMALKNVLKKGVTP